MKIRGVEQVVGYPWRKSTVDWWIQRSIKMERQLESRWMSPKGYDVLMGQC